MRESISPGIGAWSAQAILRALTNRGYDNLILRTSKELDLRDNARVAAFLQRSNRVCLPRRGQGRRHPGQQYTACGVHLR